MYPDSPRGSFTQEFSEGRQDTDNEGRERLTGSAAGMKGTRGVCPITEPRAAFSLKQEDANDDSSAKSREKYENESHNACDYSSPNKPQNRKV